MELENDWNVITNHFWLSFCNTKLDAFISFRAILAVMIWWFKSYIFLSNPTLEQVLYINLKKKRIVWFLARHTLDVRFCVIQTCFQCFNKTGDAGLFWEDCAAMQQKQSGTRCLGRKNHCTGWLSLKKCSQGNAGKTIEMAQLATLGFSHL